MVSASCNLRYKIAPDNLVSLARCFSACTEQNRYPLVPISSFCWESLVNDVVVYHIFMGLKSLKNNVLLKVCVIKVRAGAMCVVLPGCATFKKVVASPLNSRKIAKTPLFFSLHLRAQ